MISSDQIAKLCRDASYGEYPWDSLLRHITEWVGGEKAMLLHSSGAAVYKGSISYNHDPEMRALYNEHYCHLDPRTLKTMNFNVGETHTSQQILPNDSFKHTAYYSDITLTADVKDAVHGVISDEPALGRRAISIQRGFKSEFFGDSELKKLSFVISHLDRAFRNSLRIAPMLARQETSQALVYGLIDSGLHLHLINGPDVESEKFFNLDRGGHKLLVTNERLIAILPNAIREAATGLRRNIRLANGVLSLAPAPYSFEWAGRGELAFFIMSEPVPAVDASLFSSAFGLTQRESQILDQLLVNKDREDIGRQLNISNETLRWHIKSILSKSGYSNVSELASAVRHNDFSNFF